jgi:hypothetical protein
MLYVLFNFNQLKISADQQHRIPIHKCLANDLFNARLTAFLMARLRAPRLFP